MNLDALKAQLILHEGLSLTVYEDTVGIPTIGCGRNLKDKGITATEAIMLLDHDIDECVADLTSSFPWFAGLSDARQRALVDLRFNLGAAGLRKFRQTLAAFARGDFEAAAQGLEKSRWFQQVKRRGTTIVGMVRNG